MVSINTRMIDRDKELIWESYIGEQTDYDSMTDDQLRAELKRLTDEIRYYDSADDPQRYRDETIERERAKQRVQQVNDMLSKRQPGPREDKPKKLRFIPGAVQRRMTPRDVNLVKQKFREDGTYEKMGIMDNMRDQTRVSVFNIKYNTMPTKDELLAVSEPGDEMVPIPFFPDQHPDLEGIIWDSNG